MYQTEDIEIFVLTYNRAQMLDETLYSIANQTVQGFGVKVFDNGSIDNTLEVIQKYGFDFHRNEINLGSDANFELAQKSASKKWVMLFHDDDLLAPDYIEKALFYMNKYDNVDMITAGCVATYKPDYAKFKPIKKVCLCKNKKDFALYLFLGLNNHFGSTLYKTEIYKNSKARQDIYGKIADRPMMLDSIKDGQVIILDKNAVQYRLHEGQDSNAGTTGPFIGQFFNLIEKYHSVIKNNGSKYYDFVYDCSILTYLHFAYGWMKWEQEKYSFKDFLELAYSKKLIDKKPPLFASISDSKFAKFYYRQIRGFLKRLFYKQIQVNS